MIHGKPAFFVETREVLRLAFEIEKVDKHVSSLNNLLPGAAREHSSKKCLIDKINEIEGVHSSRKEIGQALAFLRDDRVEPLYRACIFHDLFEYIHPFYDGNGRLGRFILSCCISKEPEPLLACRISETIQEKAGDYRSAFDSCNDRKKLGDVTPFLLMQLRMILDSLGELERSLWQRMTLWARYETIIPALPGAENGKGKTLYSFLIQAGLFSEGGIPTRGLLILLNVKSDSTLKKMLAKIPERFLDVQKKGTTKFYQMNLQSLDEIILLQEMAKNKKQ